MADDDEEFNIVFPFQWKTLPKTITTANADVAIGAEPYYHDMITAGCTLDGRELDDGRFEYYLRYNGVPIDTDGCPGRGPEAATALERLLYRESWLEKIAADPVVDSLVKQIEAAREEAEMKARMDEALKRVSEELNKALYGKHIGDQHG